ncbi:lysozyme [Chromobacterium sphagni]|uniref:Lysozyme n=1 Tax=Chromobacterium sphagni TaxID=1903179 RepID=A0A1S1X2D1_9NEIS|nr:lysozyme [Chromobacterium sphagni]OHX13336.1 muraminidase [Chromobacterium sphagni]OHX17046.1 muraminidase [Chromobacterium sphagni]
MQTSNNGINLIKQFEGIRLTAYQDSVGVWTIGYGHTGADVRSGLTISQNQAEQLLRTDLGRFETGVGQLVTVPLNQNQFDALVSFSYNLGLGNLKSSTLLRLLNNKDYNGAAGQFPLWDKAGGQVLAGLHKRRLAEQALFETAPATVAA